METSHNASSINPTLLGTAGPTEVEGELLSAFLRDRNSQSSHIESDEIGRSFYRLAKVHYDKADLSRAQELFLKSIQYATKPRDAFYIFKTLGFLIRIASEQLDDVKANFYIAECEGLQEELAASLGTLNCEFLYNQGVLHNYRGEFLRSREYFQLTYRKAKEEHEPELLAKCLYALAANCLHLSEFDRALDCLLELEQLLKIVDKSYLRGSMNMLLGQVYSAQGRFDLALANYEDANRFLQEKKCWNQYGYVLLGRGMIFKQQGKYDQAATYYKMALEVVDRANFKRLTSMLDLEVEDLNDNNIDLYLDRTNRRIQEKSLGVINFKHRFVLLEILFLLAKSPGQYFDKDQLSKAIWKEEYNPLIHDKLIYTSVSRLRKLIEPKNYKGEKRKYLIRGKDGYCFNPEVKIRFHFESKGPLDKKSIANIELSDPV